ncbi:hypothetical protein [Desmospora profundinema]|uniref:Uncharacterized protein n=1 Tax=Desmospora profundinema TaxID=1571184 RepID=A0ABU1IK68_9BACL|nr:hypothetical protein [Desmospora profundinema]MDR6225166.1 hypothetical protein [Desmospora profundinema]
MSTFQLKMLSFAIALFLFFSHQHLMSGNGQVDAHPSAKAGQGETVGETVKDTAKKMARTLIDPIKG